MARYITTQSARIEAPPSAIYRTIADYRDQRFGHARIIPPRFFRNLQVVSGGVGAGTEITFEVHAFGTTTQFRSRVSEPEPGRVLVEQNLQPPGISTFTVDAEPGGDAATVTISTDLEEKPGLLGRLERVLTTKLLTGIYREELKRLAEVARERAEAERTGAVTT